MPISDVWEKCAKCGDYWDGLRLKAIEGVGLVCPKCRGISNWQGKVDKEGRV